MLRNGEKSLECHKPSKPGNFKLWLAATALFVVGLACSFGGPKELFIPDKPTQYTAEVQTVTDAYVVIDAAGNVVDFD